MSAITSQPTTPTTPSAASPVSNGIRWLTRAITVLAVVVGPLLYLLPDRTDTLFALTINPPITAAFLGAAYCTALALDLLAARERIWARVRVIYPSLFLFVVLTLVATLLHLDKFHFNSPGTIARITAWAWLVTYIVVPVATLLLLVSQMRLAGGDSTRGSASALPPWLRGLLAVQSLVMLVAGVGLFVAPGVVAPAWPWTLTPLTAQAIGAWLVGFGMAAGQSVLENTWERTYITFAASTQIELHDASNGTDDSVFFLGDSITAAAFTRCPANQPSFAELVRRTESGRTYITFAASTYITFAASTVLGILELVALARFAGSAQWTSPAAWLYLVFIISLACSGVYGVYASRHLYRRVSSFSASRPNGLPPI